MKNKKTKEKVEKYEYPDEWMNRFFDWDKGLPGKVAKTAKPKPEKIVPKEPII